MANSKIRILQANANEKIYQDKNPEKISYHWTMRVSQSVVHGILLTAFLLVIGHGLVPHWHHRLLQTPVVTASQPTVSFSILGAVVSLDLGENHLENFASPESTPSPYPAFYPSGLAIDLSAPVHFTRNTASLPGFSPDVLLFKEVQWLSSLSFRAPPALA